MGKKISDMSVSKRVQLAEDKTRRIVKELRWLIDLHENNALVFYSPLLADQIPESHAAKAFNVMQASMLYFEIVRLCTLWGRCDVEKFSIPTVVELADDKEFQQAIHDRTKDRPIDGRLLNPDPAFETEIKKALRDHNRQFAQREADKSVQQLKRAIELARITSKSERLTAVKNLRDKHLAHLLERTRAEKAGPVEPMKHGDERPLIEETIEIVEGLHLGIIGSAYDFKNSREIASKNAQALWGGCKIEVLR